MATEHKTEVWQFDEDWKNKHVQSRNFEKLLVDIIEPQLKDIYYGKYCALRMMLFDKEKTAIKYSFDNNKNTIGYFKQIGINDLTIYLKNIHENTQKKVEKLLKEKNINLKPTKYEKRPCLFYYDKNWWIILSFKQQQRKYKNKNKNKNNMYSNILLLFNPNLSISTLSFDERKEFGLNKLNQITTKPSSSWIYTIYNKKFVFQPSENYGCKLTKNINLCGSNITSQAYRLQIPNKHIECFGFTLDQFFMSIFDYLFKKIGINNLTDWIWLNYILQIFCYFIATLCTIFIKNDNNS